MLNRSATLQVVSLTGLGFDIKLSRLGGDKSYMSVYVGPYLEV